MLLVRCQSVYPVCLFMTLVYYGQTVGWIKMKHGTEVGLGPNRIVLDGDPAHPPQRGTAPQIFGPCLLCPNGWLDQDATWYGGRPWPRRHCEGGTAAPNFRPMSIVAKQSPISATAEHLSLSMAVTEGLRWVCECGM